MVTHTKYKMHLYQMTKNILWKHTTIFSGKYLEAAARQHQRKGEIFILFLCSEFRKHRFLEGRCFPTEAANSGLIFGSGPLMFQMKFGKDGAHVIARMGEGRCKRITPYRSKNYKP